MSNPIRSLLDEPRPSAPPVRVWRDWALLTVVCVAAMAEGLFRGDLPLRVLAVVMTVGLAPLLLWRRTHPFTVVAVAFGVSAGVDLILIASHRPVLDMFTMVYLLVLPYALFRWGSGREAAAGLGIIVVPATTAVVVNWTGLGDAVAAFAVLLSACALGWAVRLQRSARERTVEQVKADERVLLARELHDTVAHHVSAIAIQAQMGRALAASSPSAPLEALEVIEVEASRTLAEMRAMVRVLRKGSPVDYAPQSGVVDLAQFAGTSPPGIRVNVTLDGDLASLPAAIDAAVFRIVQEAVTNGLRHPRNATAVVVHVTGGPSSIEIEVRDDGDPVPSTSPDDLGFGLTGMKERALLLGGACSAGPSSGRGWIVRATLPREVSA